MKTQNPIPVVLALLSAFFLLPSAFGQGSLTPSGPPGPTMLTLAQIEPRTPIAANTTPGDANDLYVISQPGSYYLTTNIVTTTTYAGTGIEILANNVTLDLNGFSVSCTSTNYDTYGIYIPNDQTNITVRNGNLNGWNYGVFGYTGYSVNLVFEKLNVSDCNKGSAVYSVGIGLNSAAVIRDCTVENDETGINCNADVAPNSSLITDCTANNNIYGINFSGGGIISGCTANDNSQIGIFVEFNQYGYSTSDSCLVSGCAANNNATGIYIQGARNRVEDNHAVKNSYAGIYVDNGGGSYTNNLIIGNSAEGSGGGNFIITGTQITGPIITATGTITSTSPWANFSF
jgi:parallel beta-helix repeat protein